MKDKDLLSSDEKRLARASLLKTGSYKLAFEGLEFLAKEELRPLRLQLELMKPEYHLQQQGVRSTIVAPMAQLVTELTTRHLEYSTKRRGNSPHGAPVRNQRSC